LEPEFPGSGDCISLKINESPLRSELLSCVNEVCANKLIAVNIKVEVNKIVFMIGSI